YAILGTGQNLWTLGQHYQLTREKAWLKSIAPQLTKSCRWINQQRDKTRRLGPDGEKLPEWGLFTPGTLADWERYAYYFYANAFYDAGWGAPADARGALQDPGADALRREAENYRRDILRAYRWNQARMPVLPLADGPWVPAYPSSLYCFGRTVDFYKGMSAVGHEVEVCGKHVLNLGVLDPE